MNDMHKDDLIEATRSDDVDGEQGDGKSSDFEAVRDRNVARDITFGELRGYLSVIDRLSVCMLETMCYENFICINDVPNTYDEYYVYGVGMIKSEFFEIDRHDYAAHGKWENLVLLDCMEVMLSKEPKSVLIKRDEEGYKREEEEYEREEENL